MAPHDLPQPYRLSHVFSRNRQDSEVCAAAPSVCSEWSEAAKQRRFYSLGRKPQVADVQYLCALKGRSNYGVTLFAAPLQGANFFLPLFLGLAPQAIKTSQLRCSCKKLRDGPTLRLSGKRHWFVFAEVRKPSADLFVRFRGEPSGINPPPYESLPGQISGKEWVAASGWPRGPGARRRTGRRRRPASPLGHRCGGTCPAG